MAAGERDVTTRVLRHWIITSHHYIRMKLITCFAFFGLPYFLQLCR